MWQWDPNLICGLQCPSGWKLILLLSRTEKIRWIDAVQPKKNGGNEGEKIYEEWGEYYSHTFLVYEENDQKLL